MFSRKKYEAALERMNNRITGNHGDLQAQIWKLRNDFELLVVALGMEKKEQHIKLYVKKGMPEQGG